MFNDIRDPQMSLFVSRVAPERRGEWRTGPIARPDAHRYVHLIRANDDPERSTREARKSRGVDSNKRWRELLRPNSVDEWRHAIVAHLQDGVPRTFNQLCVELGDITADIAFEKGPDRALWDLVEEGILEHTLRAPIRFRLAQNGDERAP